MLAMMTLTMTSCNDWLTVHPQTQIVEENFWEDKTDLEGVRYAAYKKMADQVEKMIIWGDIRSDIYDLRSKISSDQWLFDNFRNIREANIDTTMGYYDWSPMYTTIGYCNKVLQHGEEILDKDKQFTDTEWQQMKAEMVTMRALSYFYLVRAFKSIPYSTKVVNSDLEVEYFPQLPVLDVMDSLITDVESVAGTARKRFVNRNDTKGMITNTAVYALLSDMYLWRGSLLQGRGLTDKAISDYKKCIETSEKSITELQYQFDEDTKTAYVNWDEYCSWTNAPVFNNKPINFMYKNDIRNASRGTILMDAYYRIFTMKNSYESIFELQFSASDGRKNTFPLDIWGTGDKATLVQPENQEKNKVHVDMRHWINGWENITYSTGAVKDAYVLKWSALYVPQITDNIGETTAVVKMSTINNEYNNWIIWRLSDMLLNNAEARACLVDLGITTLETDGVDDKGRPVITNKVMCNKLLRMVNRRWWVNMTSDSEVEKDLSLDMDYDITGSDLLEMVMNTRKLEFVAEGKRWFDLVRWAERKSTTDDDEAGMRQMYDTFMAKIQNYQTARNRCENLWGLYSPIFYMECKAYRAGGSNITQNPVWNKSKYDRK